MQPLILYCFKSMFISAALLLYYKLALRNTLLHSYNRFYLLISVVVSLLLPLLRLEWFTLQSGNVRAIALLDVINASGGEKEFTGAASPAFNWQMLPAAAVATVCIIMLLVLLQRILKIHALRKTYPNCRMDQFNFISTDLKQAPFSFLDNLFWRNDLELNSTTGQQILQHELTHIRQKHTWDKLFMQVVLSVCWMNPFFWLIRNELYLVHEFIADESAVRNKDASAFAAMLLATHYGKSIFSPAQSFSYSPIKRRLFMLTKSKQPRYNYLRRLSALPVFALLLLLFAFKMERLKKEHASSAPSATPFKLVVDAGHGGKDAGAIGLNNAYEKDLTLMIAKKLQAVSGKYNIEVVLSRNSDNYMSPAEKADFANSTHADALVSIHVNSAASGAAENSGMEVVVSDKNQHFANCRLLGSAILQTVGADFKIDKSLQQKQQGIWILHAPVMPAVLIECGYMNNANDMSVLSDDAKTTMLAERILQGVASYANEAHAAVVPSGSDTAKPQPLYVIDGKIKKPNAQNALDKNEIKSVTVLKDSSATDKYGETGKNGVVEVITGKPLETQPTSSKSQPLYLLDGEEVTKETLDHLKPADIESINVWKDEKAKQKYGIKGAGGVVEVTSKSAAAKSGK